MVALCLASASPRRLGLLEALGFEVQVVHPKCDETPEVGEGPEQLVERLSQLKASSIELERDDPRPILGADTIVVSGGDILGKPRGAADAHRLLLSLQGRAHRVISGYCVLQMTPGGERICTTGTASSEVWFRSLSSAEISAYVETGEGLDKAGGYGIQGLGAALVREVRGSYSNVVGLPLEPVLELLRG